MISLELTGHFVRHMLLCKCNTELTFTLNSLYTIYSFTAFNIYDLCC